MLGEMTARKMKVLKLRSLHEKDFGTEFGIKLGSEGRLALIKINNRWQVLDIESPTFDKEIEDYIHLVKGEKDV